MTEEQVIKHLRFYKDTLPKEPPIESSLDKHWYHDSEEHLEAIDMAIKALEQKPCDDCVSRKAVIDLIVNNHTELNGLAVVMYSPFYKDIEHLPSVTPQVKQDECSVEKEVSDVILVENKLSRNEAIKILENDYESLGSFKDRLYGMSLKIAIDTLKEEMKSCDKSILKCIKEDIHNNCVSDFIAVQSVLDIINKYIGE